MKTILLLLISISCYAQLTTDGKSVTLRADTMEVSQAFKLLHYMIPKGQRINKIVLKDGKRYVQTKYLVNRMLKRYAYIDGSKKLRRI